MALDDVNDDTRCRLSVAGAPFQAGPPLDRPTVATDEIIQAG